MTVELGEMTCFPNLQPKGSTHTVPQPSGLPPLPHRDRPGAEVAVKVSLAVALEKRVPPIKTDCHLFSVAFERKNGVKS
jgi:hypothetical protein